MSDSTPLKQLLHQVAADFGILAAIVLLTMLLMNVCVHNRHIERDRGLLIYTPEINKNLAIQLSDNLAAAGLFDGAKHVFWLGHVQDTLELHVVASQDTLQSKQNQSVLTEVFSRVCHTVFPDQPITVRLANADLKPQRLLLQHVPHQQSL